MLRLRSVCLREKVAKRPRTGAASRVLGLWRFALRRGFPGSVHRLTVIRFCGGSGIAAGRRGGRSCIAVVFAGMSVLCSMFVIVWPGGPACRLGQRVSGQHRVLAAQRGGRDVTGRGAGEGKPGPALEHAAFDEADRAGEMAGSLPDGAAAGDHAGARDRARCLLQRLDAVLGFVC